MSIYSIAIVIVIIGIGLGWLCAPNHSVVSKRPKSRKRLKPGQKLTNKKGVHYEVTEGGGLRNTETISEFLDHPNVKKQLDGIHRMYMQQTLMALYDGNEPPNSVGGYGILTKKKLMSVWDEDWQAELDNMNEYYDVTYNSFFGISEEFQDAGIVYTSDEIVNQYGREEENS